MGLHPDPVADCLEITGQWCKSASERIEHRARAQAGTGPRFASPTAGVGITMIRSWLGRVSLDTTNHYAQANLETKRKALERLAHSSRSSRSPPWKREKERACVARYALGTEEIM